MPSFAVASLPEIREAGSCQTGDAKVTDTPSGLPDTAVTIVEPSGSIIEDSNDAPAEHSGPEVPMPPVDEGELKVIDLTKHPESSAESQPAIDLKPCESPPLVPASNPKILSPSNSKPLESRKVLAEALSDIRAVVSRIHRSAVFLFPVLGHASFSFRTHGRVVLVLARLRLLAS